MLPNRSLSLVSCIAHRSPMKLACSIQQRKNFFYFLKVLSLIPRLFFGKIKLLEVRIKQFIARLFELYTI